MVNQISLADARQAVRRQLDVIAGVARHAASKALRETCCEECAARGVAEFDRRLADAIDAAEAQVMDAIQGSAAPW